MTDQEWEQDFARCLGMYLAGEGLVETDERGRRIVDSDFLVLFNAHHERIAFTLAAIRAAIRAGWSCSTPRTTTACRAAASIEPQSIYPLQGRSLALLQRRRSTA